MEEVHAPLDCAGVQKEEPGFVTKVGESGEHVEPLLLMVGVVKHLWKAPKERKDEVAKNRAAWLLRTFLDVFPVLVQLLAVGLPDLEHRAVEHA